MRVSKLTEGLGLTDADIKVFEYSDWNGQRAATTILGIMRMFVCCEEILTEKRSLSHQNSSGLEFFKSSSRTLASPPILLDIGDEPENTPAVTLP
jgi:hypothetical protein